MVWLSADCETPSLRRGPGEAALPRHGEKGDEIVEVRPAAFMSLAYRFMRDYSV